MTAKAKRVNKRDITRAMIGKAIEKAGGKDGVNRLGIIKRLQKNKTTAMTPGQANLYYHAMMKEFD